MANSQVIITYKIQVDGENTLYPPPPPQQIRAALLTQANL